MLREVILIERMVAARGWGKREWELLFNGYSFRFCKRKKSFVDEEELQLALGDGQNLNWGSEKKVKIITNNNNCNSIYHKLSHNEYLALVYERLSKIAEMMQK